MTRIRTAICPLCGRQCNIDPPVPATATETYPVHWPPYHHRTRPFCEASGWLVEDNEFVAVAGA